MIAGSLAACDLERLPYGSYTEGKIEQDKEAAFDILLNGCYAQLKDWADVEHRVGEYSADNVMIRGGSSDGFMPFISYKHYPDNYRLTTFWNNSYKIISQSSDIMKMAKEGESTELNQKLGEAYYLRGTMYFYLCRVFGRPYYQSPETNLGVPIVNGLPDDMGKLDLPNRSTVKQTYAQAIADLRKAESLMQNERTPAFATKAAAQAMLSRIYLYMGGTYETPQNLYNDSSIYYANEVLKGKYSLVPTETFKRFNEMAPEDADQTEMIFAVKHVPSEYTGDDYYDVFGGMYATLQGQGWGEMYATESYMEVLRRNGKSDARWAFIDPQYNEDKVEDFRVVVPAMGFVKGGQVGYANGKQTGFKYLQPALLKNADGSLKQPLQVEITEQIGLDANNKSITDTKTYTLGETTIAGDTYYTIDFYGQTYTGEKSYVMALNRAYPMFYIMKCSMQGRVSHLHSPAISRLAEIYLNAAEAYAKKGDYGNALMNLNMVRERALGAGNGYASLDPSNAKQRINDERRAELAFEAQRVYDIFRNGETLKRRYPSGGHDAMVDIAPTDLRVVHYIPQSEINAYPGALTQNP